MDRESSLLLLLPLLPFTPHISPKVGIGEGFTSAIPFSNFCRGQGLGTGQGGQTPNPK